MGTRAPDTGRRPFGRAPTGRPAPRHCAAKN